MSKLFQGKGGKVPFPRNEDELINNAMISGVPAEQAATEARHKMRQDVFGHDYQTDKAGNPIERGKGSAAQPTAQHQQALMISAEAEAKRRMTMGWHPGLAQAFDPRDTPRRRAPARKKAVRKAAPAAAEA